MFLENGAGNLNFLPSFGGVGGGVEGELAFAIVAKGGGFEARLTCDCFHGGGKFGG